MFSFWYVNSEPLLVSSERSTKTSSFPHNVDETKLNWTEQKWPKTIPDWCWGNNTQLMHFLLHFHHCWTSEFHYSFTEPTPAQIKIYTQPWHQFQQATNDAYIFAINLSGCVNTASWSEITRQHTLQLIAFSLLTNKAASTDDQKQYFNKLYHAHNQLNFGQNVYFRNITFVGNKHHI